MNQRGADLHVERVVSGYGQTRIVNEISLSAEQGRLTVIIGPNGSGKSTLLRTAAGLLPVLEGAIVLGGHDLTAMSVAERTALGLSFVPQERSLFPTMTVHDNMVLGSWCSRRRGRAVEAVERAYEALPSVREWKGLHASVLSGGQQRQVEVARALANEPTMLLLDEPTAGVAPAQVGEMLRYLRRLVDDWGVGVLLVEQNVHEALEIADHVYCLVNGRNDMDGPASEFRGDLNAIVSRWMGTAGSE